MKTLKSLFASLIVVSGFALTSCNNDNEVEIEGKGQASFEATDAAVDAENISGVYLSVDELQVVANGQVKNSIVFTEPEVFDLMAYQNGRTRMMGEAELDAGRYDEVRLILTNSAQAWVEFTNNTTQEITVPNGSTSGYVIQGDFEVLANGRSQMVMDVDLRKALIKETNGEFRLRPTARLISRAETGTLQGSIDMDDMREADKVVVYAYLKGTFNDNESGEPANGRTRFEGSVNSGEASLTGSFTLAFLPEGEYEVILASYNKNEAENTFEFSSTTKVELSIDGQLINSFNVTARSTTSLLIDLF